MNMRAKPRMIDTTAPGASALRAMKHLKVSTGGRILAMEEFWKEHDAKHAAEKK